MDIPDMMKTALLDLHGQFSKHGIRLILGGGYGLYLKQRYLNTQNIETLLDMAFWPEARATNDLDVFFSAEVVTDSALMRHVKSSLDTLGYREVDSARFYQFVKPVGPNRWIKIDLLAGPLGVFESRVAADLRRVKPQPSVGIHARRVAEAIGIEDSCMEIDLEGSLSSGEPYQATIFVPHAFSYLIMKLFAFRDRKDDQDKNMGRHHALDILRIVAMMTRREYETTMQLFHDRSEQEQVKEARRIIRSLFADENSIGMIRMREHPLFRREIDISVVLGDLHSLSGE